MLCQVRVDFIVFFCFFFNDTATTEIYTLSLHDALPICHVLLPARRFRQGSRLLAGDPASRRSEEHTSELQSPYDLVCRLLLEKKKKYTRQRNVESKIAQDEKADRHSE